MIGSLGLSIWWSRFRLCIFLWVFHNMKDRGRVRTRVVPWCQAIFHLPSNSGNSRWFSKFRRVPPIHSIQNSEMWHMEVSIQSLLSTCVSETLDTTRENAHICPKKVPFQKERQKSSNHYFSGEMLVFGGFFMGVLAISRQDRQQTYPSLLSCTVVFLSPFPSLIITIIVLIVYSIHHILHVGSYFHRYNMMVLHIFIYAKKPDPPPLGCPNPSAIFCFWKRHHELSNTVALCLASDWPQQIFVTALGSGSSRYPMEMGEWWDLPNR